MVFLELSRDSEEGRGDRGLISKGSGVCHFCSDGDRRGQILEEFMLDKKKMGSMLLVDA